MFKDEIVGGEVFQEMCGFSTLQTCRDWARAGKLAKVAGEDNKYYLEE
jgi:hypothetical protein